MRRECDWGLRGLLGVGLVDSETEVAPVEDPEGRKAKAADGREQTDQPTIRLVLG
jgi:hypothetical protein